MGIGKSSANNLMREKLNQKCQILAIQVTIDRLETEHAKTLVRRRKLEMIRMDFYQCYLVTCL